MSAYLPIILALGFSIGTFSVLGLIARNRRRDRARIPELIEKVNADDAAAYKELDSQDMQRATDPLTHRRRPGSSYDKLNSRRRTATLAYERRAGVRQSEVELDERLVAYSNAKTNPQRIQALVSLLAAGSRSRFSYGASFAEAATAYPFSFDQYFTTLKQLAEEQVTALSRAAVRDSRAFIQLQQLLSLINDSYNPWNDAWKFKLAHPPNWNNLVILRNQNFRYEDFVLERDYRNYKKDELIDRAAEIIANGDRTEAIIMVTFLRRHPPGYLFDYEISGMLWDLSKVAAVR